MQPEAQRPVKPKSYLVVVFQHPPNSVTKIESSAFKYCEALKSITLPSDLIEIGDYCFNLCWNLESIELPGSVESIGMSAFSACGSLKYLAIPKSTSSIGQSVIAQSDNIKRIDVDPENPYFCSVDGVLYNKEMTRLILFPPGSEIVDFVIPYGIEIIEPEALWDCYSLNSIVLPPTLLLIDGYYVTPAYNISKLYCLSPTPPIMGSYRIGNENTTIYVPSGSLNNYQTENYWDTYNQYIEMGMCDIALSAEELELNVGQSETVGVSIEKAPEVTVESQSWSSSNTAVATVDQEGCVTAISKGRARITFSLVDSYGCTRQAICYAHVRDDSGIEDIDVEASDEPEEYYNLNGIQIPADRLAPGIYIRRQGTHTSKVLIH